MALPAGFAPASVRLEDECLISLGHGSRKLVSAAGLAPAVPRFQAEHVAATPRAVCPGDSARAGGLFWSDVPAIPLNCVPSKFEMVGTAGFPPAAFRSQAGRSKD